MWALESGKPGHKSQTCPLICSGTLVSYWTSLNLNSLISQECYQEHLPSLSSMRWCIKRTIQLLDDGNNSSSLSLHKSGPHRVMLGGSGYQVLKITETKHHPGKVTRNHRSWKRGRKSKGERKWGNWAYNWKKGKDVWLLSSGDLIRRWTVN